MLKKSIISIYISVSLAIFLFLFVIAFLTIYLNVPNGNLGQDKYFIIEKGDNFKLVTKRLHQKDIIKYPRFFLYTARLIKGRNLKVHHGEYLFKANISRQKIINKINQGDVHLRKITIAEGLSTHSILKIIDETKYLAGEIVRKDVNEGSILPETYLYHYQESKSALIKRMQQAMFETINKLWKQRDKTIPLRNKREAIILASIVEKETGMDSERPMIASVFVNRLRKRMKLQSDPTIIYSFTKGNKSLERVIRRSDINNKSPINTYHIYGLPPTPICNPGIDSIKAVLNPPKSNYLYFVAKGDGSHNFSSNIKDHNNYVIKYRKTLNQ